MANVRQRKILNNGKSNSNIGRGRTNTPSTRMHKPFVLLVGCALSTIIIFGVYTDRFNPIADHIARTFGYEHPVYAVIVDAGSTGTRVIAYTFHREILGGRLVLDEEFFDKTKPGLSSFHEEPEKGAESIYKLLEVAKTVIPERYISETPLVLRATAGLRLLQQSQADSLLNAVEKVVHESGFKVTNDSVGIMDGTDEGIFSWFTVNLLLGRLGSKPVAALDLGGGSNQVTFDPTYNQQKRDELDKNMHSVTVFKSNITVFTHSYLGLGLMAVRHAVLVGAAKSLNVTSICVNPIVKNRRWTYNNVEYIVSGPTDSLDKLVVPWDRCWDLVSAVVMPNVNPVPTDLKKHDIVAFSYFYDRAVETGLVETFVGGRITLDSFEKTAQAVCANPNTDQPFMCLDLTFIIVLLKKGFQLPHQTRIRLVNKIDNHEISWALGCAYNVLNKS